MCIHSQPSTQISHTCTHHTHTPYTHTHHAHTHTHTHTHTRTHTHTHAHTHTAHLVAIYPPPVIWTATAPPQSLSQCVGQGVSLTSPHVWPAAINTLLVETLGYVTLPEPVRPRAPYHPVFALCKNGGQKSWYRKVAYVWHNHSFLSCYGASSLSLVASLSCFFQEGKGGRGGLMPPTHAPSSSTSKNTLYQDLLLLLFQFF